MNSAFSFPHQCCQALTRVVSLALGGLYPIHPLSDLQQRASVFEGRSEVQSKLEPNFPEEMSQHSLGRESECRDTVLANAQEP